MDSMMHEPPPPMQSERNAASRPVGKCWCILEESDDFL